MLKTPSTALLVIDVQVAFVQRDERGDARSNPDAERRILQLLEIFRERDLAIVHIHHHSLEPESLFRAELPGAAVQEFAAPRTPEPVYIKHANGAFIGTTLENDLHQRGIDTLVCCGATGNHCVETTTRMAGNLGFDTYFIHDAVWTYDATGPDGRSHTADEVLSMTVCNLHNEFATVLTADELAALI